MATHTACPTLAEYQRLAAGQLADAERETLLEHLEGCDTCAQKFSMAPGPDKLLNLIHGARDVPAEASEEAMARLIDRLSKLRPGETSAEAVQTLAPGEALPVLPLLFACPACGRNLKIPGACAGQKVQCPLCLKVVRAPAGAPITQVPALSSDGLVAALTIPPEPRSPLDAGSKAGANAAGDSAKTVDPQPANVLNKELCDCLAPPQAADELGRLGPYRVLEVLGVGGMGVVFRAEDPQLARPVALKAMLPGLAASKSARERFLREARAAAAIKHDHIVAIYQVGEDRGVPFLAMELLEGEPLEDRLKRKGKLPLAEVLRIGREMADGLAAAHERGLIHRDIKPANVWLEGKKGRVKILDFGLARAGTDEAHLTHPGAIVGTPAYMAPEQAQGKNVDPRSDLFSLGCVLYRMATGEAPFRGTDIFSTLMAVGTENPAPPVSLNFELPAELSDFIMQLLAKKPKERPESALAVTETLDRIARDEQPPRPPTAAPRQEKAKVPTPGAGRRGRRIAVAVLALALLVPLGFWLSGIIVRVESKEGTLVIKTEDPSVSVKVTPEGGATLTYGKDRREIHLKPGKYGIELANAKEGLKLSTTQLAITSGENRIVEVFWEKKLDAPPAKTATSPPDKTLPAPGSENWLVLDGFDGLGNGKHIVLVSGDEEYRSEEALPQLAKILAKHHGFKCTVLFAIDPKDGTIKPDQVNNIPGLEALKSADLMIIFTRFRDLPDDQMKYIADYLDSGKPVIGLRTATHAFNVQAGKTYSKYSFQSKEWDGGFGHQVLGQTWTKHQGVIGKQSTRGILVKEQENHPILRGIKDGDIWAFTDVYFATLPLPGDSKPLVLGQVLQGMQPTDKPLAGAKNDPMMPVAWVKTFTGASGKPARVFTTTMGASQDLLSEGMRRLLVNAAYWTVGLEDKITDKANVSIVGEYKPHPFAIGGFEIGHKPGDHAIFADGKGFVPLFNGKDLTGWKSFRGNIETWSVKDGLLYTKGSKAGWLMTEKEYDNFELRLEFKVSVNANSGVALRAPLTGEPADHGMEIQIIDDDGPVYKNPRPDQQTGSIYTLVPPSKRVTKPAGEWNQFRITCKGPRVMIELNGTQIVDANLDVLNEQHSKQHGKKHPGLLRDKGHLGLQSHTRQVEFRKIEIKELPPTKTEPLTTAKDKPDGPVVLPALGEKEAKKLQEEWAAKLKLPVEAENMLGMKLRLIPPGEGVAKAFYLGNYEVTQGEWQEVMGYNPSAYMDTSKFPVEQVSWYDSVEFCNKLSEREGLKPYYELTVTKRSGKQIEEADVKILGGSGYHIPTCAEWEHGCRAGTKTKYHSGDNIEDLLEYAWIQGNSGGRPHAVGEKKPNAFGLYDMHGNVYEWNENMLTDANTGTPLRVHRGGCFGYSANYYVVSARRGAGPAIRYNLIGFRVARVAAVSASVSIPAPFVPPTFGEKEAKRQQADWAAKLKLPVEVENKIGMKLRLIPPGDGVAKAFYLGKYEVTQGEWVREVMGYNPSWFVPKNPSVADKVAGLDTSKFPVEQVSWFDSVEFCNKLSELEGMKPYYELTVTKRSGKDGKQIDEAEVKILGGSGYHIPTDAEWEHGCRAGTITKYHCGDKDEDLLEYAWFEQNSGGRIHAVGEKKPNAFGLYDMHGNVREWNEEILTKAGTGAPERFLRGGIWSNDAHTCAVTTRLRYVPARNFNHGLRVARAAVGKESTP